MARVTVEDCVKKLSNRFELVAMAAQRARDISSGSVLTLERDNDKNPVVALREIAEESITLDELRESLISGLQIHVEADEPEEEEMDFLGLQSEREAYDLEIKSTVAVIGDNAPTSEEPVKDLQDQNISR